MNPKRLLLYLFGIVIMILLVIQLIPVDKENPKVIAEPAWDSPQTRELAKAACFDCHSNETVWPWYASIAPAKFLLARDVEEGREELNFSEWGRGDYEVDEIGEKIRNDAMPPWYYEVLHSEAQLSDAEKDQLIAGMNATFGASGEGEGEDSEDEDEEEEDDD